MGRYADMVYTTCHRILGDEAQAADAVQETFFQLAKDAKRIRGSLGGWLHRVATRRAVDVIRQNVARREREESYVMDSVCRVWSWSEVEPVVDEALEELPENLREILLLHFLQGRTTTQIAETQGLSQPTISRRMNEGLQSLRRILRERGVEAGLVPLETLLVHSNHLAPEALRYGLGKIALAKATLSGGWWAAWTSGSAGVGGAKIALASAAVALVAGTTWVARRELSSSPASVVAPTPVAQPALASRNPGASQVGIEGEDVEDSPQQPSSEQAVTPWSRSLPRGMVVPRERAQARQTPRVGLPPKVSVETLERAYSEDRDGSR